MTPRLKHSGLAMVAGALALLVGAPAMAARPVWAMTPAFQVAVSLTPKASARMGPRETVLVDAEFYGEATPKGVKLHLADEMDWIQFPPDSKVELKGAGIATIEPRRYDSAKLPYIRGGKLQVLINVYSGRRTSGDNLIDCGIFEDSIDVAARSPIQISCKLIGEP